MVQNFRPNRKDDEIRVKMDITVDLPAEVAEQAERMGICEFDQCTFDEATRRMIASVTTVFYRKGACSFEADPSYFPRCNCCTILNSNFFCRRQ